MQAIIMAGGRGKRMYPYTTVLPKPLLPVGETPILDYVLKSLSASGFKRITLAVGYLSDLIKTYAGDGKRYNMRIDYSAERKPLGTIGPIRSIKGLKRTFLVMNGDLLTDLDFKRMLKEHKRSGSLATLAVKKKKITVDLGVVEFDDKKKLTRHREKPSLYYHVGIGVCYFEPEILDLIPRGKRFDFPDLVKSFMKRNLPINIYETDCYWRDVGRWEDYLAAQKEFKRLKRTKGPSNKK